MYRSLLFLLLLVYSCSENKKPVFELPENAGSFITADSVKTWKLAKRFNDGTRMNMGDCFLAYRQTFARDSTMSDNAGVQRDCGETLYATWKFAKDKKGNSFLKLSSGQIPELMQLDEDFKFFKILGLSENEMILEYRHKQYGGKNRTITDHYVPENVAVEDRNFHW